MTALHPVPARPNSSLPAGQPSGAARQALDLAEFRAGLARYREGHWSDERWRSFRLQYGIFAEKEPGRFMVRTRLPGGQLDPRAARSLARLARRLGNRPMHLSTRQGLQLYGAGEPDFADLLADLQAAGLETRHTGGRGLRNVTTCPYAGVCIEEVVDGAALADRLTQFWLCHPSTQHMAHRLRICVVGCQAAHPGAGATDLAIHAHLKDGVPGYEVRLGALRVTQNAIAEDLLPGAVEAAIQLQQRFSQAAGSESLAAIVERLGPDVAVDLFAEAFDRARSGLSADWRRAFATRIEARARPAKVSAVPADLPGGVRPQGDGVFAVRANLPGGQLSAETLERVADIADEFGAAALRVTTDQALVWTGIEPVEIRAFMAAVTRAGLAVANDAFGGGQVVACGGDAVCRHGLDNTLTLVARLHPAVADRLDALHVSGCARGCAGHHRAARGLEALGGARYRVWRSGVAGEEAGRDALVSILARDGVLQPARREAGASDRTLHELLHFDRCVAGGDLTGALAAGDAALALPATDLLNSTPAAFDGRAEQTLARLRATRPDLAGDIDRVLAIRLSGHRDGDLIAYRAGILDWLARLGRAGNVPAPAGVA